MNHLAHFMLAHPDPALIAGGFLGDFVKGRLNGQFPADIERGIKLHRAIDAFSDRHPVPKRSISQFPPGFRRYGPIMVDVIYDHFLAIQWNRFNEKSLDAFSDEIFSALKLHDHALPERAQILARRMSSGRSLHAYHEELFVARALSSIAGRLNHANPLADAFPEFQRHKGDLLQDFQLFFPDIQNFCDTWLASH